MSPTVAAESYGACGGGPCRARPSGQKPRTAAPPAVRFVGDSGDGMQLTGSQFTIETALLGNDVSAAQAARRRHPCESQPTHLRRFE
jgi:hypothetical protein